MSKLNLNMPSNWGYNIFSAAQHINIFQWLEKTLLNNEFMKVMKHFQSFSSE